MRDLRPSPVRVRLSVAARVAAALPLGYALSGLADALLAQTLPLPREEAVTAAALTALLVWPAVVVWCFAARTAWRAWMGLLIPGIALALAAWLTRGGAS